MAEKRIQADKEMADFLAHVCQWHKNGVRQLEMIVDENNKDASIDLNGEKIDPDSDLAMGVRIGISVLRIKYCNAFHPVRFWL